MVVLYPITFPLVDKKSGLYSGEISSKWNDKEHLLFDPYGGKYNEWRFRFGTVPGVEEMTLTVYGSGLKMWVDGEEIKSENIQIMEEVDSWKKYRIKLQNRKNRVGKVAFSIRSEKGYQGAGIIREPVQLKTATGLMRSGNWAEEGSLRYYSGGISYKMKCKLPGINFGRKVILSLGEVIATCEVKINGRLAGVLISPPYELDVTQYIQEGVNDLEVLVYSTLSNHYQTIPTPYRGEPKAGLIGPVQISILTETGEIKIDKKE